MLSQFTNWFWGKVSFKGTQVSPAVSEKQDSLPTAIISAATNSAGTEMSWLDLEAIIVPFR